MKLTAVVFFFSLLFSSATMAFDCNNAPKCSSDGSPAIASEVVEENGKVVVISYCRETGFCDYIVGSDIDPDILRKVYPDGKVEEESFSY